MRTFDMMTIQKQYIINFQNRFNGL